MNRKATTHGLRFYTVSVNVYSLFPRTDKTLLRLATSDNHATRFYIAATPRKRLEGWEKALLPHS